MQFALPDCQSTTIFQRIGKAEREEQAKSDTTLDELRGKVAHLSGKLQRLLDSFFRRTIDRQTYLAKKAELMSGGLKNK